MICPPVALIVSTVGLFRDARKGWALAGLVIAGVVLLLSYGGPAILEIARRCW